MADVNLFTEAKFKAYDSSGVPLSGGKVYTYEAGTSTPLATYDSSAGTGANDNPTILDSRGEADIWFQVGQAYKVVLKDSDGETIWTVDDLGNFDGEVIAADQIRAVDGDGLKLTDDGDNGIFIEDGGNVYIGTTTTNAKQTLGLTINQGANDDEIISLKSSDVAHGITDYAETDTYGYLQKQVAASGGLRITGVSEGDVGLALYSLAATADDTDAPTTSSSTNLLLYGAKKTGTTVEALTAAENLLTVQNAGTNEFVIKGDGEIYSNQSATVGTFDDYDDPAACEALADVIAFGDLKKGHKNLAKYNRQFFEEEQFVTPAGLVSQTKMNQLKLGAIGQLGQQIKVIEQRIEALEG